MKEQYYFRTTISIILIIVVPYILATIVFKLLMREDKIKEEETYEKSLRWGSAISRVLLLICMFNLEIHNFCYNLVGCIFMTLSFLNGKIERYKNMTFKVNEN